MDANVHETKERISPKMRPMRIGESLLYFIAVTSLIIICFYIVRPELERLGLNEYAAYLLSLSFVSILMLIWTLISFIHEGNPMTWIAFRNRLRLNGVNTKVVGLSFGLGLLMFLSTIIFSPLIAKLVAAGLIPLPEQIPDYINPLKQLSITLIKAQMASQGVLPFIPLVLLLNIFGEELFWRGIVFPRQELRHGKHTFLIHGFIWGFAHLFQYWLVLPILLSSLALSYLIQRTKNTWIGIIAHILNNGLPFIIMIFIPTG
jgi:membrane protease YdiL (CAAX protease family)